MLIALIRCTSRVQGVVRVGVAAARRGAPPHRGRCAGWAGRLRGGRCGVRGGGLVALVGAGAEPQRRRQGRRRGHVGLAGVVPTAQHEELRRSVLELHACQAVIMHVVHDHDTSHGTARTKKRTERQKLSSVLQQRTSKTWHGRLCGRWWMGGAPASAPATWHGASRSFCQVPGLPRI